MGSPPAETDSSLDGVNDVSPLEPTTVDAELAALAALVDVFEALDDAARKRVLDWAHDRFWPVPVAARGEGE